MTRSEFKNEILKIFNYYGFKIKDSGPNSEWIGVQNTLFSCLKRDITIRTQGETMIVNGKLMQSPGKIGNITLKVLISSGVGELNDCNEISIPMLGIHFQAIFQNIIFKEYHEMVEIGETDRIRNILVNFLHIFGM